jgi:hypothetical protein
LVLALVILHTALRALGRIVFGRTRFHLVVAVAVVVAVVVAVAVADAVAVVVVVLVRRLLLGRAETQRVL